MCYPKVSEEHQEHLRDLYCSLMQDPQPMVRRTVATNLINFATVLQLQHIKEVFIPLLDNLVQDNHVSCSKKTRKYKIFTSWTFRIRYA